MSRKRANNARAVEPGREAGRKRDTAAVAEKTRHGGWSAALIASIAIAVVAMAVVAFRFHPIGDYFAESDFYGGYAPGAEAMRHGRFDPSRYGVYGPVYEVVLALVGVVFRNSFTAARLISVLAAGVALACVAWAARRRLGEAAAIWLVALVAVNPTFFRYGYSATTDMLGASLALAGMAVVLALDGRRAAAAGGALVALAAMTRYNLVSFVPAGVVALLLAGGEWRPRWVSAGAFLAGFLVLVAPFTIWTVSSGHPPGLPLLQNADFYTSETPGTDIERAFRDLTAPAKTHGDPAPSRPPLVMRTVSGVGTHLAGDARELLGWPVAALVVVALAALVAARSATPLVPYAPFVAFAFMALAPVFYSERYALVLVPLYLTGAALWLGQRSGGWQRWLRWVAGLVALFAAARAGVTLQSRVHDSIPREALEAGETLRALAQPGDHVLARKAHVAHAAGLGAVLFPAVDTLDSLAAYCRAHDVRWLYYSWYEARTRPRFEFLLDTTLAVPGLEPVCVTRDHASVTYRIGPAFGQEPAWAASASAARNAVANPGSWKQTPQDSGLYYSQRASAELAQRRALEALGFARAAVRLRPHDAEPRVLEGESLVRLRRPKEALVAFEQALALDPRNTAAGLGRGWSLFVLGRHEEAAAAWRPLIRSAADPTLLSAMADLYTALGDVTAAEEARSVLARLQSR